MKKISLFILIVFVSTQLFPWIAISGEKLSSDDYTFFGKYLYLNADYFTKFGYQLDYFKESGIVILSNDHGMEIMMKVGSNYFWINRVCYISKLTLKKSKGKFWIPAYDICGWLGLKLADRRGEKKKKRVVKTRKIIAKKRETRKKIDFSSIFKGKKTAKLWREEEDSKKVSKRKKKRLVAKVKSKLVAKVKSKKIKKVIKSRKSLQVVSKVMNSKSFRPFKQSRKRKNKKKTLLAKYEPKVLEEGINYYRISRWHGKRISAHIVEIEKSLKWNLKVVLAHNKILEKEHLAKMVIKNKGVVGINGSFFDRRMGIPLGIFISKSKILSTPIYKRTAIGFKKNGKVVIGVPQFGLEIWSENKKIPVKISSVNQYAKNNAVMIYTTEYGTETPNLADSEQVVIVGGKVVSVSDSKCLIPPDGYVVVFTGDKKKYANSLSLFSEVKLKNYFKGDWKGVIYGLGAGPRLVKHGKVFNSANEEKFQNDIKVGYAPRSAIGISEGGKKIYFITIDGRQKKYKGMSLNELARFMVDLGIEEGINLDGGGSATLAYKNRILNHPSERRAISNAIIVCKADEDEYQYACKNKK